MQDQEQEEDERACGAELSSRIEALRSRREMRLRDRLADEVTARRIAVGNEIGIRRKT
jgi:hypothetical protein